MGFGGDTPPPPQNNPGRDLIKYVKGLGTALPSLTGLESTYRPEFGALNLADISGSLLGTGGRTGLLGLGEAATTGAQQQIGAARDAEFADMLGNAGTVSGLLGAINPSGKSIADASARMATDAYTRAQGLTPQEKRMSDQQAREAFGARGRINDNASVAAEIMGRDEMLAGKRAEANQLGNSAFNINQQFTSPALSLLGGAPAATALGQDYLNAGRGAVGQNTPQLVDTGAGIQLGQQHASNLAKWQSSAVAADNAADAAHAQFDAAGIAATLGAIAAFSDERLKTNKKKVGKTNDGVPIYTYNLMGNPKTEMGVMAQDLKKKKPEALGPLLGGYHTVDYKKVS